MVAAIAVDGSGNVYVAGFSDATWGSPVRAYTAGSMPSPRSSPRPARSPGTPSSAAAAPTSATAIAVDGGGNVYVAYATNHVQPGGRAFVAKLDRGRRAHLGHSPRNGVDCFGDGDRGGWRRQRLPGGGQSARQLGQPGAPPHGGSHDAFAAKLTTDGVVTWNTFLGGQRRTDNGVAIALDGSGNIYVAGDSHATWGSPVRPYTAGR